MVYILESSKRSEQDMKKLMEDLRELVSNLPQLMLGFFMLHVTLCVSFLRKLRE